MKLSIRSKIYFALALSLVIIPIYCFILPVNHDNWWIGFRLMNHAVRALSPLVTVIGYYSLFLKHKKYAYYLIVISLVGNAYLFNLDTYNIFIAMKWQSFSQFNGYMFHALYIALVGLFVFGFTVFFNVELIIKNKGNTINAN